MADERSWAVVYGRGSEAENVAGVLQTNGYDVFTTTSTMDVRTKPEELNAGIVVIDADYGNIDTITRMFGQLGNEFPNATFLFMSGQEDKLDEAKRVGVDRATILDKRSGEFQSQLTEFLLNSSATRM